MQVREREAAMEDQREEWGAQASQPGHALFFYWSLIFDNLQFTTLNVSFIRARFVFSWWLYSLHCWEPV